MREHTVGLVPAAGRGIRLGLPYPKELYPIIQTNRYKPVAQFVLDNLTRAGVGHVVFVVNETKAQLLGYFGDGRRFGCRISYVVQERADDADRSTSPGLAHALDAAYHLTRKQRVVFGMPDTIMQPTDVFDSVLDAASQADVTLALFPTDQPEKFGMVQMDDACRVLAIVDKPQRTELRLMWGGIVWGPEFTEYLHASVEGRQQTDFAQIVNGAIASGLRVRGVEIAGGTYADLGTYDAIAELEYRFRAD